MYPVNDQIEWEQVAWVFGLTGGELENRPLRFAFRSERYDPATHKLAPCYSRGWARYWRQGPPDWSELDGNRGHMFTVVWDSGSYGSCQPPLTIHSGGKRWRKIATYASGAECECPGKYYEEESGGKVTRRTAKLTPKLPEGVRDPYTGKPYPRHARCPLCEEWIGEDHGVIYLGEGWCEAVYYSRG